MTDDASEFYDPAEDGPWRSPRDIFARFGYAPVPPSGLDDRQLPGRLWELLCAAAARRFFFCSTDHLSDRELYAELWTRGLREPAHLPGRNPRGGWFHDFLGSWGEDDMQLWLRYYASDEERAKHAREWPTTPLPPKEKRPFNRDWRLPKGPF